MNRKETLEAADICVNGQREHDYGAPEDNFATIAAMWTTYIRRSCHSMNITITAHDVTVMMSLLKIGRIASGQTKDDNYVDACGYMACAAELATENTSISTNGIPVKFVSSKEEFETGVLKYEFDSEDLNEIEDMISDMKNGRVRL